jgi:flagellin-like hook-associated protein FlgL
VNLDGATSVADVISRVQTAATSNASNGGVPVVLTVGAPGAAGTDINIGLAATGNGFVIEDGTAGVQAFRVTQLGESLAADNLGIYQNAGTGSSITGTDNSQVRVDSVFSHLIALRDALMNDDSTGITIAGGDIEGDVERLAQARADAGVRAQRVSQQQARSGDMKIVEQSMVSTLQDADVTEVITRFTLLQQQMQAALSVGAKNLQLSLLDFLR